MVCTWNHVREERIRNGFYGPDCRITLHAIDLPVPTYAAAPVTDVPLSTSSCSAETVSA